jgi:hypothetical protein
MRSSRINALMLAANVLLGGISIYAAIYFEEAGERGVAVAWFACACLNAARWWRQ